MEKEAFYSVASSFCSLSHLPGAKSSRGKEEPARGSRVVDTCTGDREKSSVTVVW